MAVAETVWSKKPSGEKVLPPNVCHLVQYLLNTAEEIDVSGFLSFCPFFFFLGDGILDRTHAKQCSVSHTYFYTGIH